jgi:hypothetical protein
MATPKYIFLDTWVLGLLSKELFGRQLREFLLTNNYTVLLSSISLVELFNPGWALARDLDRTELAAHFYSELACVIVEPKLVWDAEIGNNLDALDALPIRLNLSEMNNILRKETLLRFFHGDKMFLDQGIDFQQWSEGYKVLKKQWLSDVNKIIDEDCKSGNLSRNTKGDFIDLSSFKERFLFSLDLQHASPEDVDKILKHQIRQRSSGGATHLSAVRLSSLLFWYSYVDVDYANRMKRSGSDIGDIYHLSLLPYCAAFTADKTMYRMLKRIKEPFAPISCKVMTKSMLEETIRS